MSQQSDHIRRSCRVQNLSPREFSPRRNHSPSSINTESFVESQTTIGSTQSIPTLRHSSFTPQQIRPASSQPTFPSHGYSSTAPSNPYPTIPLTLPRPTSRTAIEADLPLSLGSISPDISTASSLPSFPIPNLSFANPGSPFQPVAPIVSPRTALSFRFPQLFRKFSLHQQVLITRGMFANSTGTIMGEDHRYAHLMLENQVILKISTSMITALPTSTHSSEDFKVLYNPTSPKNQTQTFQLLNTTPQPQPFSHHQPPSSSHIPNGDASPNF